MIQFIFIAMPMTGNFMYLLEIIMFGSLNTSLTFSVIKNVTSRLLRNRHHSLQFTIQPLCIGFQLILRFFSLLFKYFMVWLQSTFCVPEFNLRSYNKTAASSRQIQTSYESLLKMNFSKLADLH